MGLERRFSGESTEAGSNPSNHVGAAGMQVVCSYQCKTPIHIKINTNKEKNHSNFCFVGISFFISPASFYCEKKLWFSWTLHYAPWSNFQIFFPYGHNILVFFFFSLWKGMPALTRLADFVISSYSSVWVIDNYSELNSLNVKST